MKPPSLSWGTHAHDALADYLAGVRRQLMLWRIVAVASVLSFLISAAIQHPAAFLALIFTVLLAAMGAGAMAYQATRGDDDIGVADTSDRNPNP